MRDMGRGGRGERGRGGGDDERGNTNDSPREGQESWQVQSPECGAAEERRETSEWNDGECARETGRGVKV
jgi:hypothetical protein